MRNGQRNIKLNYIEYVAPTSNMKYARF